MIAGFIIIKTISVKKGITNKNGYTLIYKKGRYKAMTKKQKNNSGKADHIRNFVITLII